MSSRPTGTGGTGPGSGIFTLLFREVGLFWEQAWQWSNERVRETQKYLEEQAREDRLLTAEEDKRRLADSQYRKTEAEARLLEQMRLAKESGLDPDAILRRVRGE